MANPLNRQSFTEILKYNIDYCNFQASMKNNFFVRRIFTELEKLSKLKISCPMKKVRQLNFGFWLASKMSISVFFRDNTELQTGASPMIFCLEQCPVILNLSRR
jgi:hypothetical protein